MSRDRWTDVDRYIHDSLLGPDPVLDDVLEASAAANLPPIAVSAAQGRFLHILARGVGATRILEIGTLGGYSGVWLARALPGHGRLVTIEADPGHAEVARRSFARAGVTDRVDLRVGMALDVLPALETEGNAPFDFAFIDADKAHYPEYLDWTVRLCRPGALVVADNVVRDGAVIDPARDDPKVRGVRRFMERLGADRRLTATAIQTVGRKGHDGFAICVIASDVDRGRR